MTEDVENLNEEPENPGTRSLATGEVPWFGRRPGPAKPCQGSVVGTIASADGREHSAADDHATVPAVMQDQPCCDRRARGHLSTRPPRGSPLLAARAEQRARPVKGTVVRTFIGRVWRDAGPRVPMLTWTVPQGVPLADRGRPWCWLVARIDEPQMSRLLVEKPLRVARAVNRLHGQRGVGLTDVGGEQDHEGGECLVVYTVATCQ